MAKKKTSPKKRVSKTPGQLRQALRRTDREIVKLLNERGKQTQRLAELAEDATSIMDWHAIEGVTEQAVAANKGPLDATVIRAVFRELTSGIRRLMAPIRVAYLGPIYSYSHLAAVERFGGQVELIAVATIAAVFEAMNRRQADYGLVPIENSTDGRVADTLEMFARLPVRICGIVPLRIHHHLLGKCARQEIREVYSKPQALSQCRDWLAKQVPDARLVEMTSTAAAARVAADKPGAAAIASRQAGTQYGLDVIAGNIEDNRHNMTRFAVIGGRPAAPTGHDKTALMFEIAHQPGALADAMMVFKRNMLNLTWIESFPIADAENEYLFFVEFEGHQNDAKAVRAIQSLGRKTVRMEVLGSYAEVAPIE